MQKFFPAPKKEEGSSSLVCTINNPFATPSTPKIPYNCRALPWCDPPLWFRLSRLATFVIINDDSSMSPPFFRMGWKRATSVSPCAIVILLYGFLSATLSCSYFETLEPRMKNLPPLTTVHSFSSSLRMHSWKWERSMTRHKVPRSARWLVLFFRPACRLKNGSLNWKSRLTFIDGAPKSSWVVGRSFDAQKKESENFTLQQFFKLHIADIRLCASEKITNCHRCWVNVL